MCDVLIPEALRRFVVDESSESEQMTVCETDEKISPDEALTALRQSLELLTTAESSRRALLDATAGALDEAALVVRPDRVNDTDDAVASEILELSGKVKKARQAFLSSSSDEGYTDYSVDDFSWPELDEHKEPERNTTPLIVYASQTGTAKKFATQLQEFLESHDETGPVDITNIKDLSLSEVSSRKRVYFVASTFGTGRPPRDAELFFDALQLQSKRTINVDGNSTSSPPHPLEGVEIAVAALGSSKFHDFCAFGFDLATELQSLGAKLLMPVCTINAKKRIEQRAEFSQWQEEVFKGFPNYDGKQPFAT